MLWYEDLTVADPYYTLPILSSMIFLLSVELNLADGMEVCLKNKYSGCHALRSLDILTVCSIFVPCCMGCLCCCLPGDTSSLQDPWDHNLT